MVAAALLLAALAAAPTLRGAPTALDHGPGDQTDPHVSGDWVAYTAELPSGGTEVRYRNLATGVHGAIPQDPAAPGTAAATDFLSDVNGTTLLYTHLTAAGSAILAFNASTHGPPQELSPRVGAKRRSAAMGGRTIAWQDYGFEPSLLAPEIVILDSFTGYTTRLTADRLLDKNPAVSPDGNAVVWTKCQTGSVGCDIWRAVYTERSWSSAALTGLEGEESMPDTSGTRVVYASARRTGKDLCWQPLPSGLEERLAIPGDEANPSIAGNLVAFEHRDPTALVPNWDVWLYDLETDAVYALTDSPADETLDDLSVSADGLARVVWTSSGSADYDVNAFSFRMGSGKPEGARPALRLEGQLNGRPRTLPGSLAVRVDARVHRLSVPPAAPSLATVERCGATGAGTPGVGWLLLWSGPLLLLRGHPRGSRLRIFSRTGTHVRRCGTECAQVRNLSVQPPRISSCPTGVCPHELEDRPLASPHPGPARLKWNG